MVWGLVVLDSVLKKMDTCMILAKDVSSFLQEALCNQTFAVKKNFQKHLGVQTLRQGPTLSFCRNSLPPRYKPNINHKKEKCPSPLAKHSNFESPKSQAALLRQKSQPNIHLFENFERKSPNHWRTGGRVVGVFLLFFYVEVFVVF